MQQPNNVNVLKCTEDSFLRTWLEFLTPYHHLTAREKDVAARILKQYLKLKESIADPNVLKEVLWSKTSRADMMASLGISQAHFQIILAHLKKAGFLVNGEVMAKYIPKIDSNPRVILCTVFDWSTPENRIHKVDAARES